MCEFYSYNNNQNLKSTQCNITIVCKKNWIWENSCKSYVVFRIMMISLVKKNVRIKSYHCHKPPYDVKKIFISYRSKFFVSFHFKRKSKKSENNWEQIILFISSTQLNNHVRLNKQQLFESSILLISFHPSHCGLQIGDEVANVN